MGNKELEKSKKKTEELKKLANPLIKYLNDNYHPHSYILITPTSVEVIESILMSYTEEFIND